MFKFLIRLSVFCLVCFGCIQLLRHGRSAMQPTLPSDMPSQSRFMQSGYDVARLEPTGNWIACGTDRTEQANWCRVTDAHGQVVFEGDYLPLRSQTPLPLDRIQLSRANPSSLWVHGPSEGSPVPVIPLASGDVLVPLVDREALADRWSGNPQELQSISAQ